MDVLIQVMIRERVRVRPLPVELLPGHLDRFPSSDGAALALLLRLRLLAVLLALLALGRRRRRHGGCC
mgnify:CR=1 FL=1